MNDKLCMYFMHVGTHTDITILVASVAGTRMVTSPLTYISTHNYNDAIICNRAK